jgi:DNA-directed RNA polymerase delta subunit
MTTESLIGDYKAVISDLKLKRAKIDQAIEALEQLSGIAAFNAAVSNGVAQAEATGAGDFLGLNIADATKRLLATRRRPLNNTEIAQGIIAGGLVLNSAEPANTVGTVLTRRAANVGDIVKIGRGVWGLKEWYPNRSFKKKLGEAVPQTEDISTGPIDDTDTSRREPASSEAASEDDVVDKTWSDVNPRS